MPRCRNARSYPNHSTSRGVAPPPVTTARKRTPGSRSATSGAYQPDWLMAKTPTGFPFTWGWVASGRTAWRASPVRSSSEALIHAPVERPVPRLSNTRAGAPASASRLAMGSSQSLVWGPEPGSNTTAANGALLRGRGTEPDGPTGPLLKLIARSDGSAAAPAASKATNATQRSMAYPVMPEATFDWTIRASAASARESSRGHDERHE